MKTTYSFTEQKILSTLVKQSITEEKKSYVGYTNYNVAKDYGNVCYSIINGTTMQSLTYEKVTTTFVIQPSAEQKKMEGC